MTKSVENAAAESLIMQSQRANNWGGKTSKKQSTTNPTQSVWILSNFSTKLEGLAKLASKHHFSFRVTDCLLVRIRFSH